MLLHAEFAKQIVATKPARQRNGIARDPDT
jgi:hypothetical protein